MKSFRSNLGRIACSLLGCVFIASPALAQSHYYYFKEKKPLTLDTSRVAIFMPETEDAQKRKNYDATKLRATIVAEIRGADVRGLDATNVKDAVIPYRFFVETTTNHKSADAVRTTVRETSDKTNVDFVSPVFVDGQGGPIVITPHLIIGFDRSISAERAEAILAEFNIGTIVARDWANMKRTYRVRSASKSGFDALDAANRLALHPEVMFSEPDLMITGRHSYIPNDPGFGDCWGIDNTGQFGGISDMDMDGPEAWDITTGDASIKVVIIDTGVQQNHPDVNQITGTDTTNDPGSTGNGAPVNACDNHGTPVAGCVSAIIDNNLGTVGIAPGVMSASARSFISNLDCSGGWNADFGWTVDTLAWAESIGAQVTNNSNIYSYGNSSAAVTQKYQDTRDNGMVHFASAHNDAIENISFPANLPTVNAVSALDPDGTLTSFSNWGDGIAFAAPGILVNTTDRTGSDGWTGGDYVLAQGTSFASPYTAGVAALVLSEYPGLTPDEVELAMRLGAVDIGDPGYDIFFGHGFVNAHGALIKAIPPDPCEVDKLVTSDGTGLETFGSSVSVAGDVALIGAEQDGDNGTDAGSAYVFRRSGSSWIEEQKLLPVSGLANDWFGNSVSISGDVALVGAYLHDASGADSGAAYVFRWNGSNWAFDQKLVASDGHAGARFGSSVFVSGDTAVVGADGDNENGSDAGAVYVFHFDGPSWSEQQKLLASDGGLDDKFGASVSLSGDVILIGAEGDADNGANAGAAFVFRWNGASWAEEDKLLPVDGALDDEFGASVSISGDATVIGAWGDDDNGAESGSSYVFRWDGADWNEEQKLLASDGAAADNYGLSVSVFGNRAIIGARNDGDNGALSGSAYVYFWQGAAWVEDEKLFASDGAASDRFGWAVAIDDQQAIVGSPRDDDNGSGSGSVYAYGVSGDCNLNGEIDLCEIKDDPSLDLNLNGLPDPCDCFPSATPNAKMMLTGNVNNTDVGRHPRVLAFSVADTGRNQAIRVTYDDLPPPFDVHNGTQLWVGPPVPVCETPGTGDDCAPAANERGFQFARLQCDPHWTDWSQLRGFCVSGACVGSQNEGDPCASDDDCTEAIIHVTHLSLVPSKLETGAGPLEHAASYQVEVIDDTCDESLAESFSIPLALTTSGWADPSALDAGQFIAPDDKISTTDIIGMVSAFGGQIGTLSKMQFDLLGASTGPEPKLDLKITALEVVSVLGGFISEPYPFPPEPAPICP